LKRKNSRPHGFVETAASGSPSDFTAEAMGKQGGGTPDKVAQNYVYDKGDFPMTLGEAYCAGEMSEDSFDLNHFMSS